METTRQIDRVLTEEEEDALIMQAITILENRNKNLELKLAELKGEYIEPDFTD